MSPAKSAARDIVLSGLVCGAALVLTGEFEFRLDSPATAFTTVWACRVGLTLWSLYEERRRASRGLTLLGGDSGSSTCSVPPGSSVPHAPELHRQAPNSSDIQMRRAPRRPRVALLAAIVAAAAALFSGAEALGEPMRWVHVLGLFAGGLASGAAISKARSDTRRRE